jgi:ubiquinone biosynthesis O-methyltransferase
MSRSLDEIAKDWCEEEGFERFLVNLRIIEVKKRAKGSTLLDVGCGTGLLCRALATSFKKVVGVDGSEWKIKTAKKLTNATNVEYHFSYFEKFEPAGQYDTITMTNVLEHVDDPISFLKRAKQWLSPEGIILATVPNALGLHKRVGLKMGLISDLYALTQDDLSKGHKRIYDPDMLRQDFFEAGFKVDELTGMFLKPLAGKQMMMFGADLLNAYYELGKELPDYCSSLLVMASHA